MKVWPIDPLVVDNPYKACLSRGVRKVTKGITGLWQPRVHIDVAF